MAGRSTLLVVNAATYTQYKYKIQYLRKLLLYTSRAYAINRACDILIGLLLIFSFYNGKFVYFVFFFITIV